MRCLLTKKEAAARVGYHPEHIMRLARCGAFPRPIKLGASDGCAVRFVEGEVDAWLEKRIAVRDTTTQH
jgi:predicted DNA-binding transcriptional regulator AlpA